MEDMFNNTKMIELLIAWVLLIQFKAFVIDKQKEKTLYDKILNICHVILLILSTIIATLYVIHVRFPNLIC
jgi:hypothetical protein